MKFNGSTFVVPIQQMPALLLWWLSSSSSLSVPWVEAILPRLQMKDLSALISNQQTPIMRDGTNQWMSLDPSMEYMPVISHNNHRTLQNGNNAASLQFYYGDLQDNNNQALDDNSNPYRIQPFTSGVNDYDEYQQAWRMLGFMIDCDVHDGDEWREGAQQSHSRDDNDGTTSDGCERFILWAAVSSNKGYMS
jgi:hypothetical protein